MRSGVMTRAVRARKFGLLGFAALRLLVEFRSDATLSAEDFVSRLDREAVGLGLARWVDDAPVAGREVGRPVLRVVGGDRP